MAKHLDDSNLENVSGGTLDNPGGRIEPRDEPRPGDGELDPIAAPVQGDLDNETDGSGNQTFDRG